MLAPFVNDGRNGVIGFNAFNRNPMKAQGVQFLFEGHQAIAQVLRHGFAVGLVGFKEIVFPGATPKIKNGHRVGWAVCFQGPSERAQA